ncbi:MAG: FecR domain-containing protein, partial [Bacteroidota bacterium]
ELADVIADLSNQFDVKIRLANTDLTSCPISSLHKRSDGIQKILAEIALTLKMEVRKIGNTSFELVGGECS